VKTKQCVKIPAQAFYDGKPVELKLVYGEDIKPLLLYPAQKVEYVEPLTDLQVMFKHRLFDKSTKYVIFVGYSFKDEYIARMLWDASRVNENLHVILISPNAQEIFEDKLRYVNREKKDPSRIQDRVICLPYTFKSIIFQIKNHYIEILRHISDEQEKVVEEERKGHHVENQWRELLFQCIEAEFLSKAEYILEEKLRKDWDELPFNDLEYKTRLSFKSLLHSVITKDEYVDRWIKRLNGLLEILDAKKLRVRCDGVYAISFSFNDYEVSQKLNRLN
jgi:hypothetical protein